jgi:chromosome segregation protein
LHIKSLQIQGFKSFVDKVVFEFQPGITGIVGPNGCGKSNVVDAMRWAMGEQSPRRLRGKGMEDVIFAGSEGRAALGMSEVVLTFDNASGTAPPTYASFSEIQISRRLYRSGESEYLINKVPCRLRDIIDFFRDTGIGTKGYTIVEQGQIAQVVSAKAEERRALIEEAAGIGKYKARRREAERKLEATEQNLVRVTDILTEIRRQISSIERQARKASRYKLLREQLRQLELSLAADERQRLQEEIETARRQAAGLRAEATAAQTQLAEREAGLASLRLDLAERERALSEGSEGLFEIRARIRELESQIAFERRERASISETNTARATELEGLGEQRQAAAGELAQVEEELERLLSVVNRGADTLVASEAEAHEADKGLRRLESEREDRNASLVDTLTAIARAEDRRSSVEERRAEIARRMRSADEVLEVGQTEASQADREQQSLEEGLRNLLAERDRLMQALRDALSRHQRAVEAAGEASDSLHALRETRETRRARLGSLRELVERREDLATGTRHLLGEASLREAIGLRALVRDVLEPERQVETAVEAVLADRAEALILERPEGALEAFRALRGASAGRAVLVTRPPSEPAPLGFVPLGEPLLDRIRVQPGYEEVARVLLAGVNLVDDLAEVLRVYGAGTLPATFVTPAGDVLGGDGVMRGGAGQPEGGQLARGRELRELEAGVSEIEAQVQQREEAASRAQAAMEAASDELDNLRNRHHTAALAVANHEKDLERTRERAKALGEVQETRLAERAGLLSEGESLGGEVQRLEQRLVEARQQRSERQREIDGLTRQIGAAVREVSRLQAVVGERRVAHAGGLERQERLESARQRAATTLRESDEWIERRRQEIAAGEARRTELAGSSERAEAELARCLESEEQARLQQEARRDDFERQAEEARRTEEVVRELRTGITGQSEAVSQAELAQRETELRLTHLDEQVQEKWSVELASWRPGQLPPGPEEAPGESDAAPDASGAMGPEQPSPEEADEANVVARAVELSTLPHPERERLAREVRGKLEALGEVNLSAIDEHEELGERFRFLSEQKADLEGSVTQLREAIQRINRTSRKRFRETFDAVNERFRQNFPRLFKGGRAGLTLTDSEDVLEAGIDIMAQPPGKRLQNVNLLSGGEKTLTALALLIAVFQVHHSPFFLLDEVDAALDDANVGRFNDIVREMSKESQFLLITHNKRTIEVADVLYGVTMEEKGVSTLVSVELHGS